MVDTAPDRLEPLPASGSAEEARPLVTVVGGGLAGMSAALRLTQRGFPVRLYEMRQRLGGKAGSEPDGNGLSDHGYHIFPAWYRNLWALVDELGIGDDFYRTNAFFRLDRPKGGAPPEPGTLRFKNPKRSVRLVASIVDLCSRRDPYVDKLSLKGFLRSRYYNSPYVSTHLDDLVLKALSNHSFSVSSRTMRNTFRQWLEVWREPAWTALRTSLQEGFIDPLAQAMTGKGRGQARCDVYLGHRLAKIELADGQIDRLELESSNGRGAVVCRDLPVVLAIPPEVLRTFLGDEVFRCDPHLCELGYLRTDPLGALDIHLKHRIPGLTAEHFSLNESSYALTCFDISQHWPQHRQNGRTVLQVVAGDVTGLLPLSDAEFQRVILDEMRQFLPLDDDDIERVVVHKNIDAPLVMNDVGTWEKRPETATKLRNTFVAGDYVRSDVDVASMENAVTTGILAAEAIRQRWAPEAPPVETQPVRNVSSFWMKILRAPLGLAALGVRLFDRLRFGRATG